MNHLAHLFLSQSDINLLIGNFIADHVKGKKIESFCPEIQSGIKMHRAIDEFTDKHPVVLKSKERLYPKYHKYAAVIVDMFYDHVLAKNWSDYSPISLEIFASNVYRILGAHESILPERSIIILNYMSKQDWLSNYANLNGMKRALKGLSIRAKFDSKMDESILDLERDYRLYESEFNVFFKELFEFSANWPSTTN